MLKVVLANENLGRGGAEQFTLRLGQVLTRAGHRVWLACRPRSWLADQDLPTVPLPYRGEVDPFSYLSAIQKVLPLKADVIHCHAARDLALFGSLRRLFPRRIRLIKSDHSFLDSAGSAWLGWCYRACDAVVPVSHALQQQMQAMLPFPLAYRVIPNAMDLPPLDQPIPEPMRSGRWIGYVGSLLPSKGVGHVLQAAAPLLSQHPDLRLLLAGEGPELENLRNQSAQLGIGERVWTPGHVADPLPYLAGLKILVHGSPRETFSLVALEAMALEVPVVAYAREGLPEVVVDGETGWLSRQLEPAGLREGAAHYLAREDLRRQHGQAGRARVASRFTWEVLLPDWEALYQAKHATSTNP